MGNVKEITNRLRRVAMVALEEPEASLMTEFLQRLGWEVLRAATWGEAESRMQREHAAVFVTDYGHEGKRGFDLMVDWRQREIYQRVLFVTANPIENPVEAAVLVWCQVLVKPYTIEEVQTALDEVMGLDGATDLE